MNLIRRKRFYVLIAFAALLALGAWVFLIEPNRLVVNETSVRLDGCNAAQATLRVAVLADLHVGSPFIDQEKLARVVAETNGLKPDLILLAGDFVIDGVRGGNFVEPEAIASKLKDLRAPLGVYAVLGNHDWWNEGERVRDAIQAAGIRVLENEAVKIGDDERKMWLVGLADLMTRKPDWETPLKSVPDDALVIAFAHNPDIFPELPARVRLLVAGHTHGGQVNLPLLGRLIVPSRFNQRYAAGLVAENGKHLFVSTGIGTSILPVRFRVPPEIALLTIE